MSDGAVQDYERARKTVHAQLTGKPGNAAETLYGEAYQRMVRLNLAPQIRAKYREPKRYR